MTIQEYVEDKAEKLIEAAEWLAVESSDRKYRISVIENMHNEGLEVLQYAHQRNEIDDKEYNKLIVIFDWLFEDGIKIAKRGKKGK